MVKNEDNVQVNILPGSKVVFSIKVLPDEMHKISLRALKKLGQDLALGGFRKGKAPIEILKDQVDKDKWLLEAVDLAVTEKYYDAVMLYKDKYVTITSPKIDFEGKLEHDSMEKGFIFKAEVDVYPEVELPDYEKIKIDRLDSAISDEEIQKAVTEIRNKRSTLADTLEGHEAQTGEWLDIDFDVFVDGQEIKEAGAKHFPLVIGNNTLIPGFEEELLGLKKGANKTFKIKIGQDFRDKRLAGNEVEFKVQIHEIKKVILPDYSDEFVKSLKIDGVEKIKDFEEYLINNLKTEKEAANQEKIHNQILEKIDEKIKVDLPESLIRQELDLMWHEFERNLGRQGVRLDDYLEKEKLNKPEVETGWRDQAIKRVRLSLIIREVLKKEKISVSADEIKDYINNELQQIKNSISKSPSDDPDGLFKKYQDEYDRDEIKARVEQQLMINKMFDNLILLMVK